MALRLIEMVLKKEESSQVEELLQGRNFLEHRQIQLPNEEVLVRILLDAEQSEEVLDLLEKRYADHEGNRVVILPVQATVPRPEENKDKVEEKQPERISREELYENIKDAARFSRVFLMMTLLSTLVATVGLLHNSVAIIIGAMVLSPTLGPSMALALGTALGDLSLLWRAFLTGLSGIVLVVIFSSIIGLLVPINPEGSEVVSRTSVKGGDIVVALASGCAGVISFTTALPVTLIGVMVAVSLLPPLVTFGMLLGDMQFTMALGALFLFLVNLICVNLAGVVAFLLQGIQPIHWKEKTRATKATWIAIGLWIFMLVFLIGLIFLLHKGRV